MGFLALRPRWLLTAHVILNLIDYSLAAGNQTGHQHLAIDSQNFAPARVGTIAQTGDAFDVDTQDGMRLLLGNNCARGSQCGVV